MNESNIKETAVDKLKQTTRKYYKRAVQRFRKNKTQKNLEELTELKEAYEICKMITRKKDNRFERKGFNNLLSQYNDAALNPEYYYRYETFDECIKIIRTKTIKCGIQFERWTEYFYSIQFENLTTKNYRNIYNQGKYDDFKEAYEKWEEIVFKKLRDKFGYLM